MTPLFTIQLLREPTKASMIKLLKFLRIPFLFSKHQIKIADIGNPILLAQYLCLILGVDNLRHHR